MSQTPPAWLDQAPPYDPEAVAAQAVARPAPHPRDDAGAWDEGAVKIEAPKAIARFMARIRRQRAMLQNALPDTVDVDAFIRACRAAVVKSPELCHPDYTETLMHAVAQAAMQGLVPDGHEGVLLRRWSKERRRNEVCWTPMVWGLARLGRATGEIDHWVANIVWRGEHFENFVDEDGHERIVHRKGLDAATGDIDNDMVAAYCIIHTPRGGRIVRVMSARRVLDVRAVATAKGGPWFGLFKDEMVIKTVLRFTFKWMDRSLADTPALQRFRAALDVDTAIDFDRITEGDADAGTAAGAPTPRRRLDPPASRLDALKQTLSRERDQAASAAPAVRDAEVVETAPPPPPPPRVAPPPARRQPDEPPALTAARARANEILAAGLRAKASGILDQFSRDRTVLAGLRKLQTTHPDLHDHVVNTISKAPAPSGQAESKHR